MIILFVGLSLAAWGRDSEPKNKTNQFTNVMKYMYKEPWCKWIPFRRF